jgi:lauroyl/myristoyl acyltransferase
LRREPLKERVAYRMVLLAEWLAMSAPEPMGRRLFDTAARLACRTLPGVRATVAANQAMVLGLDPDASLVAEATREAFQLYGRYWFDTFRARVLSKEEVEERMEVEGIEHIDRALQEGRGCITVLPHMGNWDVAGLWLATHGYPIASVAEDLRPKRLAELFLRHREALGMKIIPLTKDGGVGRKLSSLLGKNWIVALVADRDLTGRGVEVEMFGAPRRLPAGPALLSLSSGAPLLVCPVWTTRQGWRIRVGAPLQIERSGVVRTDVSALTLLMGKEFERAIASKPVDWHMFQPGWPDARTGGERVPAGEGSR